MVKAPVTPRTTAKRSARATTKKTETKPAKPVAMKTDEPPIKKSKPAGAPNPPAADPAPLFTKLHQFFQRKVAKGCFFDVNFQNLGGNQICYCIINDSLFVSCAKGKVSDAKREMGEKVFRSLGVAKSNFGNEDILESTLMKAVCWNPAAALALAMPEVVYERVFVEDDKTNKVFVDVSVGSEAFKQFSHLHFVVAQAEAAVAIMKDEKYKAAYATFVQENYLIEEDRLMLEQLAATMKKKHSSHITALAQPEPQQASNWEPMDTSEPEGIQFPLMTLNQVCAENKLEKPLFTVEQIDPDDKTSLFVSKCTVGDSHSSGTAKNKKDARQDAAKNMLENLQKNNNILIKPAKANKAAVNDKQNPNSDNVLTQMHTILSLVSQKAEWDLTEEETGEGKKKTFGAKLTIAGKSIKQIAEGKKTAKLQCATMMIPILQKWYGTMESINEVRKNEKDATKRSEIFAGRRAACK